MSSTPRASAVSFETLPYEKCVEEIIAFRNSQRETQRDLAYFTWRYAGKPCSHGAYVTWARDPAGVAVASASAIGHDFHLGGADGAVAVVGDIAVTPAFRGRGIASRLLAELRRAADERGLAGCFVLPNSDVEGALAKAGWQRVAAIARFVKPLSLKGRLGRRFGGVGGLVGVVADLFLSGPTAPAARGGYETSSAERFDDAYDELWQRLPKAGRFIAHRNRAYLSWRFGAKLASEYRLLELRGAGGLAGYVVYHEGEGVVTIEDFLVPDAVAADELAGGFVGAARARGVETLQARYVADTGLEVPWRGAGFVKRADSQLVMWAAATPADVMPAGAWYVTPADKDV